MIEKKENEMDKMDTAYIRHFDFSHIVNPTLIDDMVDAMRDGVDFPPPLVVASVGNGCMVLDGHHRIAAALEIDPEGEVLCYVVPSEDFERVISEEFNGDIPSRLSDLDEYFGYGRSHMENKET